MSKSQEILKSQSSLSFRQAYQMQKKILKNELSNSELLKIFTLMDRPLQLSEFYGFYKASEDAMIQVNTQFELLDTCGTGGDELRTFNISTAAAILCSALGVRVAKHGNRSASSKCGSADVLEELGVNIDLNADQVASCIKVTGFGFLFAQEFHPAFKYAAFARKIFGKRTYFNFLGPLLNPAAAAFRLVGVSDPAMAELMGRTLIKTGIKKAWIVYSHEGMDEISATGTTNVLQFTSNGEVKKFVINPLDYGLRTVYLTELYGGDKKDNAEIIRKILNAQGTEAQTNAIVLNASAGLVIAGKIDNYAEALKVAQRGIEQKLGLRKLDEIIKITNQL